MRVGKRICWKVFNGGVGKRIGWNCGVLGSERSVWGGRGCGILIWYFRLWCRNKWVIWESLCCVWLVKVEVCLGCKRCVFDWWRCRSVRIVRMVLWCIKFKRCFGEGKVLCDGSGGNKIDL